MSPAKILLLLAGEPAPELSRLAGDYAAWFTEALGAEAALVPVAAYLDLPLPDPRAFDGVVMSGSPLSVTAFERVPWMPRAGELLAAASVRGQSVLGVCFGHQLLARTLGGAVEKNPRGREIGTIEVALTEAGKRHEVLGALPNLRFQATHQDAVTRLPEGAVLLAENAFGIQAFALGAKTLCVQFHPELDELKMRAVIQTRSHALEREGIQARVEETVSGRELLAGFLRIARREA